MIARAKESLRHKRAANATMFAAEHWAARSEPWAAGNARTYQRLMCAALRNRSNVLKAYLAERARRAPGRQEQTGTL